MSVFKSNLEENEARRKYKSRFFWTIVFFSSLFGFSLLYMMGFSKLPLSRYFINIPSFSGQTSFFYILSSLIYILLFSWWFGLPKFITNIKPLARHIPENLRIGKKRTLHTFFYPEIELSDELVRSKSHDFFENDEIHIGNMFNYTAIGGLQYDEGGTDRIISFFRDSVNEKLLKKMKFSDEKGKKIAERGLSKRKEEYADKNKPSAEQEFIYNDLFFVIGGMLDEYTSKYDRIHIDHALKSPLKVMVDTNTKRVTSFSVEGSVSVFKKGKVYLSITMIAETTKKMTLLYMEYTRLLLKTNSKLSHLLNDDVMSEENILRDFEDFFKFVFFRKLLKNYGSIPSGWMCVRIESYDMRAIFSAVDRPMIPVISENEEMYMDANSDKKAASFLMSYWGFVKSKEYEDLIADLEWCFNTTVEISEMTGDTEDTREDVQ